MLKRVIFSLELEDIRNLLTEFPLLCQYVNSMKQQHSDTSLTTAPHSVHPSFCRGKEGGLNLIPHFQEEGGGGLDRVQDLEFLVGVDGKERVTFFRGVAVFS